MSSTFGATPKIPGYSTVPTLTPEQMELFKSLFGFLGPSSYLSRLAGGDESIFQQIEGPSYKQFSSQLGNLASRFSGMGGLGARQSSGFQNVGTQAASDFAQALQAQRQGLQQQAIRDLFGMSQSLLGTSPYAFMPEKEPWWKQLLGGLAGGVGQGLAGGLPGLIGGLFGGIGRGGF
jgi:hypothetical protein